MEANQPVRVFFHSNVLGSLPPLEPLQRVSKWAALDFEFYANTGVIVKVRTAEMPIEPITFQCSKLFELRESATFSWICWFFPFLVFPLCAHYRLNIDGRPAGLPTYGV
jgi:hypothetical protein